MTTQTVHSIILVILAITALVLGGINTISTRALGNMIDRVKVLEMKMDEARANISLFYEVNKDAVEKKRYEKGVQEHDNSTKP